MRVRRWVSWCAILFLVGGAGRAQDRELAAIDKTAGVPESKAGAQATWMPDFRWGWPEANANFSEILLAQGTDAFALGYYLDERSISPKGFYGVIVPRFGGAMAGRNFLVETATRRIVGVLEGPGFAFPPKAKVSWSYRWAPDGASFAIEQAHLGNQGWERDGWRLVLLRENEIEKQIDLLKEPRKIPAWLERSQPPGEVRSFPPPPKAPLVLARSSHQENCWTVQREVAGGPLRMALGDKRVGTLPPVRALADDAAGKARELGSDEIPGLPLSFFSPDERWLFVNQIVHEDSATGELTRLGAIYRRKDAADGAMATWELATSIRSDELAWQKFCALENIAEESVGPPDAAGLRNRTMEFVAWSRDSGRLLVELRARNGTLIDKDGKEAFYRWFGYFNTQTLAFEVDRDLGLTNAELRPNWTTGDGSISDAHLPLRAADLDQTGTALPLTVSAEEDHQLKVAYTALMERTPAKDADSLRQEQRRWLKNRDTLARVHVAQRWTRFGESIVDEGLFLATRLRAEDLGARAIQAQPGPNTVLRDKSPGGKFGVLYTYAEKNLAHDGRVRGMKLLALPSQRVLQDLYDEDSDRSLAVLWAPDSQHFAYHFASRRVGEFTIYARKGDTFVALQSPDFHAYSPGVKKGEQQTHFNASDNAPKRWLGSRRLLIDFSMNYDVQAVKGIYTVESYYDIIVALDGKSGVIVEKATKK